MTSQLPQGVADAVHSVPLWDASSIDVEPLVGGLSNSNWLVTNDDEQFVVKIPGPGTEAFIDRVVANEAAKRANGLGIAPEPVYFDQESGLEVTRYLAGYRDSTTADFSRTDFRGAVTELYAAFNSGDPIGATKTVFDMSDEHVEQGNELGVLRPANYSWLLDQYNNAKQAFLASGLDLAPCHNDPMPGNFLVVIEDDTIADMKMIDFEYASNNERSYELGVFLAEMFVTEDESLEFIERYYGRINRQVFARVMVARAVADFKWGSWAVLQRKLSDWDFDYQKYGAWKYMRARMLFDDPRWNTWLRTL